MIFELKEASSFYFSLFRTQLAREAVDNIRLALNQNGKRVVLRQNRVVDRSKTRGQTKGETACASDTGNDVDGQGALEL